MSAQRHQSKNESGNGGTTVGTPRSPSKGLYVLSKNQKKLRLPLYMVRQCHTLECVLDVFDDTFNDPLPLPITEECLNFVFN
uniref:Uncharacterized protein n=1 Tax=Panagrolaimus superbus TaxID=310955 RepID=A0A914ZAC0_9BILA